MSCLVVEKTRTIDVLKDFCCGITYLSTFYNNGTFTDKEITEFILRLRENGILIERIFDDYGNTIGFKNYAIMAELVDKDKDEMKEFIFDVLSNICFNEDEKKEREK